MEKVAYGQVRWKTRRNSRQLRCIKHLGLEDKMSTQYYKLRRPEKTPGTDPGPTVSAIITHIKEQKDTLVDLRVERPSLEKRFLELTGTRNTE